MASNNLEELLYEIHDLGVFDEVMEEVKKIKIENTYLSIGDLYERAFEMVLKKKSKKNISELDNDI